MKTPVWQFPFGVTFTKNLHTDSNGTVRMLLNLAAQPCGGDLYPRQEVKIPGVSGAAKRGATIVDALSYRASLALEVARDAGGALGLNYTFQGSAHTADHGGQTTFVMRFNE